MEFSNNGYDNQSATLNRFSRTSRKIKPFTSKMAKFYSNPIMISDNEQTNLKGGIELVNYSSWTDKQKKAWEILLRTPSGKALYEKYNQSKEHQIYICQSKMPIKIKYKGKKEINAGAITLRNISDESDKKNAGARYFNVNDSWFWEDSIEKDYSQIVEDKKNKILPLDPDLLNQLHGLKLSDINKQVHVILMAPSSDTQSVYDEAENYFHELKAHIDIWLESGKKTNPKEEHTEYGATFSRNSSDSHVHNKNSFASQIHKELKKLEENDKK